MAKRRAAAAWLDDAFNELNEARKAGDEAAAQRVAEHVRATGTPSQVRLFEQALSRSDEVAFRLVTGQYGTSMPLGAAVPGERLCDFCGDPGPICFFPVDEFYIHAVDPNDETRTTTFPSGTRFYACATCAPLADAANWRALRQYCGPGSEQIACRMLWSGFARNRTGPAVPVDAAGNPLA